MYTPGTKINGRFQVMDVVGQGGLGIVYVAQDSLLHRPVALKFLRDEHRDKPEIRDRFFHEVIHTSQLNHPNIVTIHDYGSYEGYPYILMEFLDGCTLDELLAKHAPFGMGNFTGMASQLVDAISMAHRIGLFHGDIKPLNVKVQQMDTGHPQLKLFDFGLSRILHRDLRQVVEQDGTVEGTLIYMAPEQFLGENIDGRTDLYSIGVIFYELLSGQPPFEADTTEEWIEKIVKDSPIPLRSRNPKIPEEVEQVILKLLSKRPQDRYADGAALGQALGI